MTQFDPYDLEYFDDVEYTIILSSINSIQKTLLNLNVKTFLIGRIKLRTLILTVSTKLFSGIV